MQRWGELCKAIRRASLIVANITTMNFNVLFELGYAIGIRKAVLPVRDSTYERAKKLFDDIGIFDTPGYENFTNSRELQCKRRLNIAAPGGLPVVG
jgi:nucleoside 2-deoxyribosyltransferase